MQALLEQNQSVCSSNTAVPVEPLRFQQAQNLHFKTAV